VSRHPSPAREPGRPRWTDHLPFALTWLLARPGAQVVVGAVILALAFPAQVSGALGLAALGGALGVAAVTLWPRVPDWLRAPPDHLMRTAVISIIGVVGVVVFRDVLTESPDWQLGDWGPQHAVLARIMPSLPGFDPPVWNQAVSTGDAPLELYPALTYLVVGNVASLFGLHHDLPLALMIVAVIVYLTIVIATTWLALEVAPPPIALVIGLLTMVDSGAVAHGGTVGLFRWALLHSALSLAFVGLAAASVLSALTRPRLVTSIAIWLCTALAVVAHPAGLLAAAVTMLALVVVALLASDVPARRAFAALFHTGLGAALGASVWMPLAERILAHGQHFPNALHPPARMIEELLAWALPVTSFSAFEYVGYLGILLGACSRRARPVFIAAVGFLLLLGMCETPYLALGLAPGLGVARLGTERLAQLARPFVWAASAYGLGVLWSAARAAWRDAPRARRLIFAAVCGIVVGATVRALPAAWTSMADRAANEARTYAADRPGRDALTAWATEQVHAITPGAWARALFEQDTHEHFHLTAETGLPSFHMSPEPDLLLRERIEDTSPASLRRFNVRWVIGVGQPPTLGDPRTEKVLGSYHIRELAEWDGKFARIERGTGEVTVTRLDDRAVDVEVTGTTAPVLVVLGTGFYPRWQAHHASGGAEPVYAYPTIDGGKLHVVAAWLAPGKTTFTCDGPLPSDHAGELISFAAVLAAAFVVAVWTRRRWRLRVLRAAARWWPRWPAIGARALQIGVPVVIGALIVRGCVDRARPVRALALGNGLRPTAIVEARQMNDTWQRCDYERISGRYDCDGLVTAWDSTAVLLNDVAPSWPYVTPAISAAAYTSGIEMRVVLTARLAGSYSTASSDTSTELRVSGHDRLGLGHAEGLIYAGEQTIEIRAEVPLAGWQLSFVRDDTLEPARPFLALPPSTPPPAVLAITARR
jgi:hypothetical protein